MGPLTKGGDITVEYIKVYADENLREHLRREALRRKVSEAELARMFLARGLGIARANDEQATIEGVLRKVIRDELRPTRHYAYLAAREAAAAHRFGVGIISTIVGDVLRRPPERVERARDQADSAAMRYAAQHLQDLEPDDPAMDAPAEPLPDPEDEVTVEDGDTASMIEGA